jgi:multiple sugar transport system permease protein
VIAMFREKSTKIIAYVSSTIVIILIIVPFLWVATTAFKPSVEIGVVPPHFLPKSPTLENFRYILLKENFARYILNSFIISIISMATILFTSSLAGFIFAKYRFPYKKFLFSLVLITAIIPLQVYMIPLFVMMYKINALNTFFALIFPFTIMSFGVFFMRQTIMSIPNDLLDSARIDGASEFWIYTKIVLYLSKNSLLALGIFSFSEAWANFIWPLVVITTKDMYTTELGLAIYQRQFYTEYGPVSAGAVVTIIPMIILFAFLRRYIMEGVTTTGIKG